MAKSKKSKPALKKRVESDEKKTEDQQKEREKTFDFGGLPDRNLKKNLGCG